MIKTFGDGKIEGESRIWRYDGKCLYQSDHFNDQLNGKSNT